MTRSELFAWAGAVTVAVAFLLQALHVLGVDTPEGTLLDASIVVVIIGVGLIVIGLLLLVADWGDHDEDK